MKRIVFMGTPEFAVPSLRRLAEAGPAEGWEVAAVVTQPDRPAGRGKRMAASPVKQAAEALSLDVLQPASLRKEPAAVEALASYAPHIIVVAAYGLILPKRVLEIPRFGCINVHASLLPAYRGASPIAAAILEGRKETGVSIMLMDEGMDTGPVLAQVRTAIGAEETAEELSARLAELGAEALVETLPKWLGGEVAPVVQAELEGEPSVVRLIKKEQGEIDWTRPAAEIERMVRAYTPWPGAYTTWQGEVFKVWRAKAVAGEAAPGTVTTTAEGPAVGTGAGLLLLLVVQPAGKRQMEARSFVNGAAGFVGGRLGA